MKKNEYSVLGLQMENGKEKQFESLGPFGTYKEAFDVWHQHAWSTVDDCTIRYTVKAA